MPTGTASAAQLTSAGVTNTTALEVRDLIRGTAEHAHGFELSDHDCVVLHRYREFVPLMNVEEPPCLGGYDDAPEIVDLPYHSYVHALPSHIESLTACVPQTVVCLMTPV